jgi:hypothetical protein
LPATSAICGGETETTRCRELVDNLSGHNDLFGSVNSSLISGIRIGKMSKLGWLIGLLKHAVQADSLLHIFLLLSFVSAWWQVFIFLLLYDMGCPVIEVRCLPPIPRRPRQIHFLKHDLGFDSLALKK